MTESNSYQSIRSASTHSDCSGSSSSLKLAPNNSLWGRRGFGGIFWPAFGSVNTETWQIQAPSSRRYPHIRRNKGFFSDDSIVHVNMPIGMLHSFKNESSKPAKMLIMVAPARLESMFFEVGVPLVEGSMSALPSAQEVITKLLAIATKYGIEILQLHP